MKIVLIGAGNVGFHLGKKLYETGEKILQVFSRNELKAKQLADQINASSISDLSKINLAADLYLLAVHDQAIPEIFEQLAGAGLHQKLVAHTSGATPISDFGFRISDLGDTSEIRNPKSEISKGVFYPLQTFSLARQPDFSQIPICVDAENATDLAVLENLARKISPHVYRLDDEQRAVAHLAAVFVNNFSNHLFAIGKEILAAKNLPFDLLLPLIRETVAKLESGEPAAMQTGPALRGDEATIQRHLHLLEGQAALQEVYKSLAQSIQAHQKQAGGRR